MPWLYSFEAVMRHKSVTHAADELRLTQGAVSQHIRKLEGHLGTLLFSRKGGQLQPYPQALEYWCQVSKLLEGLEEATTQVAVKDAVRGALHISVPTTFGTHWLMPRLPRFVQAFPNIQLHMLNRDPNYPDGTDRVDVVLTFVSDKYRQEHDVEIFQEYLVPVCTPAYAAGRLPVNEAKDLCGWTLLHIDERFEQTSALWLKQAAGYAHPERLPGLRFERQSFALQAAMKNMGVAFIPEIYVENELKTQELIKPIDLGVWSPYILLARVPRYRAENARALAFREWLKKELVRYKSLFYYPEQEIK